MHCYVFCIFFLQFWRKHFLAEKRKKRNWNISIWKNIVQHYTLTKCWPIYSPIFKHVCNLNMLHHKYFEDLTNVYGLTLCVFSTATCSIPVDLLCDFESCQRDPQGWPKSMPASQLGLGEGSEKTGPPLDGGIYVGSGREWRWHQLKWTGLVWEAVKL